MSEVTNGDGPPEGQGATPRSLRLPKVTFVKVRAVVAAAQELRGPATAAVVADQIKRAAKGQAWSDLWSTAQYLGFIEKTGDGRFDVTPLGLRFLESEGEDSERAAREALMHTGFRPILERFNTGTPSVTAIANVLREHGVPEAGAGGAAALLVEMATECGLVVDGRFKPAAIEEAASAVPVEKQPDRPARSESRAAATGGRRESRSVAAAERSSEHAPSDLAHPSSTTPVTINFVFKVDQSFGSADELAAVVRAVIEAAR